MSWLYTKQIVEVIKNCTFRHSTYHAYQSYTTSLTCAGFLSFQCCRVMNGLCLHNAYPLRQCEFSSRKTSVAVNYGGIGRVDEWMEEEESVAAWSLNRVVQLCSAPGAVHGTEKSSKHTQSRWIPAVCLRQSTVIQTRMILKNKSHWRLLHSLDEKETFHSFQHQV